MSLCNVKRQTSHLQSSEMTDFILFMFLIVVCVILSLLVKCILLTFTEKERKQMWFPQGEVMPVNSLNVVILKDCVCTLASLMAHEVEWMRLNEYTHCGSTFERSLYSISASEVPYCVLSPASKNIHIYVDIYVKVLCFIICGNRHQGFLK